MWVKKIIAVLMTAGLCAGTFVPVFAVSNPVPLLDDSFDQKQPLKSTGTQKDEMKLEGNAMEQREWNEYVLELEAKRLGGKKAF